MTGIKRLLALLATAQLAACAAVNCDEPQPYMTARTNAPISVPPGMNSPISTANPPIPQGPTAGEKLPSGRCIEQPPSFFSGTPTEIVAPNTAKLESEDSPPPAEDDDSSN